MPGVISKHHPWRCALLKNIKKYINLVVSADTEETYTLIYNIYICTCICREGISSRETPAPFISNVIENFLFYL